MTRDCPCCGREDLPPEAFASSRAKNCSDCASIPRRKRKAIPREWRERCRLAETATGLPHVVDHIVPFAARTRRTHSVRSVLICGLDAPHNWAVVPARLNSRKAWYFSEEDAAAEEVRSLAIARAALTAWTRRDAPIRQRSGGGDRS